ncbi:hypothetical protein [Tsukamurella paurometabola]|nr:hypothetical protein [Tsukamurella paurometabola]
MTDQERSTAVNAIRQLRVIRAHALVSFGFCVAVAGSCALARSLL